MVKKINSECSLTMSIKCFLCVCCSMYHLSDEKVTVVDEVDGNTIVRITEIANNRSKQRYAEFTPVR